MVVAQTGAPHKDNKISPIAPVVYSPSSGFPSHPHPQPITGAQMDSVATPVAAPAASPVKTAAEASCNLEGAALPLSSSLVKGNGSCRPWQGAAGKWNRETLVS